jgi:hypothetical protein
MSFIILKWSFNLIFLVYSSLLNMVESIIYYLQKITILGTNNELHHTFGCIILTKFF